MDNAPIHTPSSDRDMVENRGYEYLCLSLYSPFLNPIEELWPASKRYPHTNNR